MKISSKKTASLLAAFIALVIAVPSALGGGRLSVSAYYSDSGYYKVNSFNPYFNYIKYGGENHTSETDKYSVKDVASENLDKFVTEKEISFNDPSAVTDNNLSFGIYCADQWGSAKWDISALKEGKDSYLSFWIKPVSNIEFTLELQSKDNWANAITGDTNRSAEGGKWNEIKIQRSDLDLTKDFSTMRVLKLNIKSELNVDEPICFADIGVYSNINPYDGKLYSSVEYNAKMDKNITVQNYKSETYSSAYDDSNGVLSFTVNSKEFYDIADGYFSAFVKTIWNGDGYNLSEVGEDGYFKFKVKSPHSINFLIALQDNSYRCAYAVVSTTDSTDWQDIIVPVKSLTKPVYSGKVCDLSQIYRVRIYPVATAITTSSGTKADSITGTGAENLFLKVNETVSFGGMEVYKKNAGDVNNDYEINENDVTALREYLLEIDTANKSRADINGDKNIDICDLVELSSQVTAAP